MMQLSEELTSTENKVAFARQAYNDAVMSYNNQREMFPGSVVAGMFNFAAGAAARSRQARGARSAESQLHLTSRATGVDFYARQEAARRTTRWLVLGFLVSVVLVVAGGRRRACSSLLGAADPGSFAARGAADHSRTLVVLAIICGASLFKTLQPALGRRRGGALARRHARRAQTRAIRRCERLHNVVEEMAIASGVPMPEVYVLEHEDGINAFAAGHTPADAAIAVTRGAATLLKRDELQGVVAHEFSHILNGDMRLNVQLVGWMFGLLAIAIVGRIVLQTSPRTGGRDRRDGAAALMLAALAVMILGYIGVFFGRLLQAAVSRQRERLADASAVQFTRNPDGLSGALLKIAGVSAGSKLVTPRSRRSGAHVVRARACRASSPRIRRSKSASRRSIPRFAPASCRRWPRRRRATRSGNARRMPRPVPASDPSRARAALARCRAGGRAGQRSGGHRRAGRHARQRAGALRGAPARQHPGAAARFRRLRRSCARADPGRAREQGAGRAARAAPRFSKTACGRRSHRAGVRAAGPRGFAGAGACGCRPCSSCFRRCAG